MPLSARSSLLAALLAAAACAHPQPASVPTIAGSVASFDADVAAARATVNAFLSLEARQATAADSLLAPGADFIMTGVSVTARPRLAGVNGPGEIAVEEASAGVAGTFAWVVVAYRFSGRSADLNERARATVILEKQRAGWRIRHAHSSMVERW